MLFAHINFAKCSLEGLAAGIGDILKTVFVVVLVVPEWEWMNETSAQPHTSLMPAVLS